MTRDQASDSARLMHTNIAVSMTPPADRESGLSPEGLQRRRAMQDHLEREFGHFHRRRRIRRGLAVTGLSLAATSAAVLVSLHALGFVGGGGGISRAVGPIAGGGPTFEAGRSFPDFGPNTGLPTGPEHHATESTGSRVLEVLASPVRSVNIADYTVAGASTRIERQSQTIAAERLANVVQTVETPKSIAITRSMAGNASTHEPTPGDTAPADDGRIAFISPSDVAVGRDRLASMIVTTTPSGAGDGQAGSRVLVERIGDRALLELLASLGHPAGLVEAGGRTMLATHDGRPVAASPRHDRPPGPTSLEYQPVVRSSLASLPLHSEFLSVRLW